MNKVLAVQYPNNVMRLKVVEVPEDNFLDFLYEQIGCERVQLVYVDGFDIWCDEEGLYNSGSPVYKYGNKLPIPIAGNIVFTKGCDSEGNTTFFDSENQDDNDTLLKIMSMVSEARFVGTVR